MHTVLYISQYFRPSTGASGTRASRFVEALRDRGVKVVVLTTGATAGLEVEGSDLVILRVGPRGDLPGEAGGGCGPSWPWWRVLPGPDAEGRLARAMLRAARWLIGAYEVNLVLASGPPFCLLAVAHEAAAGRDLPLVVELRDAWYTGMAWPYRSVFSRRAARGWERRCLLRARRIITVTDAVKGMLGEAYGVEVSRKIHTVRHGFDPVAATGGASDEVGFLAAPREPGTGQIHSALQYRPFTIAYVGQIRGIDVVSRQSGWRRVVREVSQGVRRLFLGASFCEGLRLDWMSPHYLLKALSGVLREQPEWSQTVRVVFAGERFEEIDAWAAQLRLAGNVHQCGPVRPEAAGEIASKADVLVLTLYGLEGCDYHWCVPSKTYMYLGTGKPILALLPEGEALDLVRRAGTAVEARPDDVGDIARALKDLLRRHQGASEAISANWEYINRFRAAHQQKKFADLVMSVLGRARSAGV